MLLFSAAPDRARPLPRAMPVSILSAGNGTDQSLSAGNGTRDTLVGGSGTGDTLIAGTGPDDSLLAGAGADQSLSAGGAHATLIGGAGLGDTLSGSGADDILKTGGRPENPSPAAAWAIPSMPAARAVRGMAAARWSVAPIPPSTSAPRATTRSLAASVPTLCISTSRLTVLVRVSQSTPQRDHDCQLQRLWPEFHHHRCSDAAIR